MKIIVTMSNRRDSRLNATFDLPVDQEELKHQLSRLGIICCEDTDEWQVTLKSLPINIEYIHERTDEYCEVERCITKIIRESDFIEINLLAEALDICEGNGDLERLDAYLENYPPSDCQEFINIVMQTDDINWYWYENSNIGSIYANYAYGRFGDEVSDYLYDYVDWDEIGRDYSDSCTLREYGYIYNDNPGCVDETEYDFEEICSNEGWQIPDNWKEIIEKYSSLTIKSNVPPKPFTVDDVFSFMEEYDDEKFNTATA